jgi:hypothetical protein
MGLGLQYALQAMQRPPKSREEHAEYFVSAYTNRGTPAARFEARSYIDAVDLCELEAVLSHGEIFVRSSKTHGTVQSMRQMSRASDSILCEKCALILAFRRANRVSMLTAIKMLAKLGNE